MRLIDEIEAPIGDVQSPADVHAAITRKHIRESPYWPRIRAALLAGEEMRQLLWEARAPQTASPEMWLSLRTLADNRFRAATEGTK